MRALVTGDHGFIGRVLVARLRAMAWEVGGLRTNDERIDVRDVEGLRRMIWDFRPDVVFHLAGVSGPMLLRDDPAAVIDINCIGTLNVMRTAVESGVPRVVYGASVSSYARVVNGEVAADSVYGVTKRFGEMLSTYFAGCSQTAFSSVRIGSVYGAGRETFNPVHEMVRSAKHDGVVRFNANQREPMIWVDDCAKLIAGLASARCLAPRYDAVTELLSHREMAEKVASVFDCKVEGYAGPEFWYPLGFSELRNDGGDLVPNPMRFDAAIAEVAAVV